VGEWRSVVGPCDASEADLVGDVDRNCTGLYLAFDEVGGGDAKGTGALVADVDPVNDVVDEAMRPLGIGVVP
jgi:hypothetical protein